MSDYNIGDMVRLWATFKVASFIVTAGDPAATYALTDPTTVALTITTPDGTATSYTYALAEVTKDSTGVYYRDLTFTQQGEHSIKWSGTGAVVIVERERFYVHA